MNGFPSCLSQVHKVLTVEGYYFRSTSSMFWLPVADQRCVVQVRAAVPMYLLSRKIKALGFKVVMSGEGADEVFGGYLYFHKAPNAAEFHRYGLTLGHELQVGKR